MTEPDPDPGTVSKTAFFIFIGLLVVAAIIVLFSACGPAAGGAADEPSAGPPAVVGGGGGEPTPEIDNRLPRTKPRGPSNSYILRVGDKLVTAGVYVHNKQGQLVQARITMVFNAIDTRGGRGSGSKSSWDAEVDSGYQFHTTITPQQEYAVLFEVTATYVGGRPGDLLQCAITSGGGVLNDDIKAVMGSAPVTAHCYVSVSPPIAYS